MESNEQSYEGAGYGSPVMDDPGTYYENPPAEPGYEDYGEGPYPEDELYYEDEVPGEYDEGYEEAEPEQAADGIPQGWSEPEWNDALDQLEQEYPRLQSRDAAQAFINAAEQIALRMTGNHAEALALRNNPDFLADLLESSGDTFTENVFEKMGRLQQAPGAANDRYWGVDPVDRG